MGSCIETEDTGNEFPFIMNLKFGIPAVTKAVVHYKKILLFFLCDPSNKGLLKFNGTMEVLEQGRLHNLLHLKTLCSPALLKLATAMTVTNSKFLIIFF